MLTCVDISSKALLPEVKSWLIETLTSLDTKDPTLRYKKECIKQGFLYSLLFLYMKLSQDMIDKINSFPKTANNTEVGNEL